MFIITIIVFFRHNMKELDALQQSLNVKLRSSNTRSDPENIQEQCSVIVTPHCPFAGLDATEGNKPLKTLGTVAVQDIEHKSPRANFEESNLRHDETSVISNDGSKLPSLISSLEIEQAHDSVNDKQTTKRTIDTVLDNRAGAFNSNNIFPFNKGKDENLQHDPVEDGGFSGEKQRSLAEEQQPSVNSELSVSDISGDLSVSGYVQDNTRSTRYADLKDSWLSSEEEDNADISRSEKPGLSSALSAFNAECLNNAANANVHCHGIDYHASGHDDNGDEDCLMLSHVDRDQSLEDSTGNHDVGSGTTVVGSASGACTAVITSEGDHEDEYSSYNTFYSRKWPKQALLSSHPTSFKQTGSAMLPNFFIPSEQLEESMRALRLGSSTKSSHSKLLAHSEHLKTHQQTTENSTEKFAKRQPVYKARKDETPPISNSEVDRIARIFSFSFGGVSQTKSS